MTKKNLEQFFVPKNSEAFPKLHTAFLVYLVRNFYEGPVENWEWANNKAGAAFESYSNPKISFLSAEQIFQMEKSEKENSLSDLLVRVMFHRFGDRRKTLFGKSAARYSYLMKIPESILDNEKDRGINTCYQHLQENIAYVNSPGLDRYCLQNGEGVCRHLAPLLRDMLDIIGIQNQLFGSWGHVWVRVNDSGLGKFDLDPSWYVTPTRLPLRKKINEKSWESEKWVSELERLNRKSN